MSLDELEWMRRRAWLCPHHPTPGRHSFGLNETHLVWDFSCGRRETWWMSVRLVQWWGILPKRLISLSQPVCLRVCCSFSRVQLFETPWTLARQAPLSMGFSRQEYWSGLPCPLPGDLLNPGIKPTSLMSPVLAGGFFTTRVTWEAPLPASRVLNWVLHEWTAVCGVGVGLGVEGHWERGRYESERVLKKCSFWWLPSGLH